MRVLIEAERTSATVLLKRTRIDWADGPQRTRASDFSARIRPEPLLAFFALYKLQAEVAKEPSGFEVVGDAGSYVDKLHNLLDNARKSNDHWLRLVFGNDRRNPRRCRVADLIKTQQVSRQYVARLATAELLAENIELVIDGQTLTTEADLRAFLTSIGIGGSPVSKDATEHSRIPAYWGYRPWAHADIRGAVLQCEDELTIVGIALTTISDLLADPTVLDVIADRLLRPHPLSVTIVVLTQANHPRRNEAGGSELETKIRRSRRSLKLFHDGLTERVGGRTETPIFQLRTYPRDVLPRHFLLKADDTIYFGSYLSHKPGAHSHLFKVTSSDEKGLYSVLRDELRYVVDHSVPCMEYLTGSDAETDED